jgi:predicted glycosyltransferase involved in capsule biosynthesis
LLNENTDVFTYSENYKQMMSNIFEVNEDLKKNIPKNIEIINYFPIYYLNSIWTTLLLKDKLENADDLYSLFKKYVSKDKEYEIPKTADFLFMLKII